jgi:NAD(P)-dependent dehydrogenase (short-subunit alcohol dehydrogenase family)
MSVTRLDGVRIVVTGGGSGMGAALVASFPSLGAQVVSFDRDERNGAAVAASSGAHYVATDVTSEQSVRDAFTEAVGVMGGLDVLVHAAGVAPAGFPEETTVDIYRQAMDVNALGTLLTNVAAFEHMRESGGRILNFASDAGVVGLPLKAAYAMSKGAVVAWTRSAAQAWGKHGITVNMISPAMWTPMFEKTRSELDEAGLAEIDAKFARQIFVGGRLGDLERDFVPPMAFYCSPGARFLTGQIFAIDGGLLMPR